jgi:hypothetical protein
MHPTEEQAITLGRLAYEQATEAIAQQQHVLETLRSRASAIFSGATISTTFLGGQAITGGHLRAASWVAVTCFVIVGALSTANLWPRLELEMTPAPSIANGLEALDAGENPVASKLSALTNHLRLAYEQNESEVARIAGFLRISTIFLTFEVLWWVADLATRT